MTDQKTKKLVIVIGAGASADFRRKEKDEKEKDDKSKIAMPTGEDLVRSIGDLGEVVRIFGRECTIDKKLEWSSKPAEVKNKVYELLFYTKFDIPLDKFWDKEFEASPNNLLKSFKINEEPPINSQVVILLKDVMQNYEIDLEAIKNERNSIIPSDLFERIANKTSALKPYADISRLTAYYQPFSIDELLDSIEKEKINIKVCGVTSSAKDLIKAGKDLIAYFLLKAENEKVFEDFESICWYRHLRNMIITSGAKHEEIKEKLKNLTIISFNYDRSLEYFLRSRLGEFYEVIKTRILYPYGYLAEEHGTEDYGAIRKEKDLFKKAQEMAKELKTIGEAIGNEKEIKEAIKEAEKIYFLGFGFHEQNCRLLASEGVIQQRTETKRGTVSKKFYYTNFGGSKKTEEKFVALTNSGEYIKTSTKGVYDALREDFDLSF